MIVQTPPEHLQLQAVVQGLQRLSQLSSNEMTLDRPSKRNKKVGCLSWKPGTSILRAIFGVNKAYCNLCEYGEFKLDKLQIDILFKAKKRKLTPHLKKLCHEFFQNCHQFAWIKKLPLKKLGEQKKNKK